MGSVRSSWVVAASLVAVGSVVAAAAPASARQASPVPAVRHLAGPLAAGGSPAPIRAGVRAVPAVPKSAKDLGKVAGDTSMRLIVTLKVRNQAALTSFISALSDRKSPLFHHFLQPGQFGARFGATPSEVSRVDAALRSAGLVPGRVSSNRLSIPVHASAAAAEHAFGTTIAAYRLANGRRAYLNSAAVRIPSAVAPFVTGVLGFNTVDVPKSLAVRPAAFPGRIRHHVRPRFVPSGCRSRPEPCAAASEAAATSGSYTADELASVYGMSPLYGDE